VETTTLPVSVGCHVDVNLLDRDGNKDRLSVDIVLDEVADFANGFLGASTPLAKILLGEKAGTIIPYLKDDIFAIEILSVTPSTTKPPDDAQDKRAAEMQQTIREVEHTSAVVFASSFSGKWGDYDPDSLPDEGKPKEDHHEGEN
jgi:hypothetical protein